MGSSPRLRFRVASPELLALPWRERLAEWDMTVVAFRDIPVGPSRHLVRFVEADGRLWALKDLPHRVALKEYDVLREMETRSLSAVRAAGLVMQGDDAAVLVTHYLEGSWQYRRLLMRVPTTMPAPRARLFDAMAGLLVDLHRNGIYWGDCSLANTLFMRDGQYISAWMVDAETAEFHATLSDGQRALDLEIMTENVTGGLLDVAARLGEPPEVATRIFGESQGVTDRYRQLWDLLHDEPMVGPDDQVPITNRVRLLEDQGFEIDEVRLEPAGERDDRLRLQVAVAGRTFHTDRVRELTGLAVGQGQARILLADVGSHRERLAHLLNRHVDAGEAAHRWLLELFTPGADRAHEAVGRHGGLVQAYCDLLEVRWLLSEEAGHDVGDEPALAALAERITPGSSAAHMSYVELPTSEMPAVPAAADR